MRFKLAFPGHRDPFTDFHGRIWSFSSIICAGWTRWLAMLAEEPRTAFGMCEALFGSRLNGNAHQLRFAMSETLAHLVYLERKARIASDCRRWHLLLLRNHRLTITKFLRRNAVTVLEHFDEITEARYVRIWVTDKGLPPYGPSLFEIEIYE